MGAERVMPDYPICMHTVSAISDTGGDHGNQTRCQHCPVRRAGDTRKEALGAIHLHGVMISKVKGFGKRSTFFANDRTIARSKIEILPMSRMSTPSSGRSRQFAQGRDR